MARGGPGRSRGRPQAPGAYQPAGGSATAGTGESGGPQVQPGGRESCPEATRLSPANHSMPVTAAAGPAAEGE